MNQNFVSAYMAPNEQMEPALWFLFRGFRLLVRKSEAGLQVPLLADGAELGMELIRPFYLGYLNEKPPIHCYAAELPEEAEPPQGMRFQGLRRLYGRLSDQQLWLGARAVQIVHWQRTNQFCGRCGAATEDAAHERAKVCPNCQHTSYPRISPAIIVRVTRQTESGEKILLARSERHPPGWYSVLAGFVEPGETLETCVSREICEEVGIEVKNIRYFGSQPWPFPDSLMIGFTAEYASGEIRLEEEIVEAAWFRPDDLPQIPSHISISRALIDEWVERQNQVRRT